MTTSTPPPPALRSATAAQRELDKTIRDNIDYLCKSHGMTRAELARQSGLSQSVLSRILSGKRRVNTQQLSAIASALHITPDALFLTSTLRMVAESLGNNLYPEDKTVRAVAVASGAIPLSLSEFMREHGSDITRKEMEMVMSIGRALAGTKDVMPDFWLGVVRLYRESGGSKL